MATKNTVWLISGGTSYYLSGGGSGQTSYTGSGTPWTAESTTPYELALNDAVPLWVPAPAPNAMIYGGGPPFVNGRLPAYQSFDSITEQVGVQLRATTKDNAIALLRQLRQILNTAIYAVPCILAVTGGTNTGYAEIYSADVSETPAYISEPDGVFRTTITWTRYPHFTRIDSGETLINAVSIKNTGTGSPDNIESLGTGAGDLLYDQQPLNVSLTPGSGAFYQVFLAVVNTRTYSTTGAGTYTTSSTSGVAAYSLTHTLTNCLTIHNLKPRVIVRASAYSGNVQLRFTVSLGSNVLYTSAWVTPIVGGLGATIIDLGSYPVDLIRQRAKSITAPTATIGIEVRSSTGTSQSVTTTYTELLLYSTFAKITVPSSFSVTSLAPFQVNAFQEQTGAATTPYQAPSVYTRNSSAIDAVYDYRGTLPLYSPSSSIYAAWIDGTLAHSTTASATLTVTHAPLWQTLRGGT